ncbi:MAG TPA: hypothetical protein VHX67_00930 [Acidimicrobiales bacterium]|nr:hypothetical protein [Acidimicrobiales bacterium]
MEKDTIALAARLLVKAQGTTFDAEAAALTAKAYRLLADALNAHDDGDVSAGATRKRERRLLRDRRATSGSLGPSVPRQTTTAMATPNRRVDWNGRPTRGQVDLRI